MKLSNPFLFLPCLLFVLPTGCGGRGDHLEIPGSVEVTRLRLSFGVGGTLETVNVEEGERVVAGETLAMLDTIPLHLEVNMRAAELAALQATLEGLENGLRPQEIGQALAGRNRADAVLELAQQDYDRVTALLEADAVSRQDWESVRTALLVAEAGFASANQSYSLASEGFRDTEVQAAGARVQASEAALALALERFGNATMISPSNATVLSINSEPGENLASGGIAMTLGLLDTVEVIAWITEPSLALIRPGQAASVVCDGYPDTPMPAVLFSVSDEAEFTPSTVETREERVSLVYRVSLEVPNPDGILKAGMPVDVSIPLEIPAR